MNHTMCNRHEAMSMLPKGGTGCEIGVQHGDNSAAMVDCFEPMRNQ